MERTQTESPWHPSPECPCNYCRTPDADTIYLTDNGRAVCGTHLGSSARHTGRDLSGQEILKVTPEVAKEALSTYGYVPACEDCGKKASLLIH